MPTIDELAVKDPDTWTASEREQVESHNERIIHSNLLADPDWSAPNGYTRAEWARIAARSVASNSHLPDD